MVAGDGNVGGVRAGGAQGLQETFMFANDRFCIWSVTARAVAMPYDINHKHMRSDLQQQ